MKFNNKQFKTIFLKSCFILSFFYFSFLPLFLYSADYKLLEPITGATTVTTSNEGIETYIRTGYNYLLGLTIALSVLMIVLGGVEYTTAFASETAAGSAKKRIENAVTGLLIALLSYAALYMINPNLTNMSLPNVDQACKVEVTSGGVNTGTRQYYGNAAGTALSDEYKSSSAGNEEEIRTRLVNKGVIETKVKCPPCQGKGCVNCVNLNGLGTTAVNGLEKLKEACGNCRLFVSGGTEGGHGTHCIGCNQVDIRPSDGLNQWVFKNGGTPVYTKLGPEYRMSNGDRYLNEAEGTANHHWHVYFANP